MSVSLNLAHRSRYVGTGRPIVSLDHASTRHVRTGRRDTRRAIVRYLASTVVGWLIMGSANAAVAQATSPAAHPTLRTQWAAHVTPDHVLPEYPRPQLVRRDWTNLNGRWEYAIRDTAERGVPARFDGTILVPFPIESQLSGVQRSVTERQALWYRRTFRVPVLRRGDRLLLHFGAVDWETTVYVNRRTVGTHRGGYDPFTLDVTDALTDGTNAMQTLAVRVWDPTDRGGQPRGKQVQRPEGIFYTSVTGIWQTVWLERVPATYIDGLVTTTDIDAGTVTVRLAVGGGSKGGNSNAGTAAEAAVETAVSSAARWEVRASANGTPVASASGATSDALVLRLPNARLWSPTDPFLYDLDVRLTAPSGTDSVRSYVGLRKIAVARDSAGIPRLCLNNHPLFQFGPLDQGWWPDGLYTAPTDDALRFDIEQTKRFGFNMIRKHVKVEPARWYYYADRLGMLVWQDMPSGDNDTQAAKREFEEELTHVVDALRNHPSIVMWVPFNEGWGQYDTQRIATWLGHYDSTRLVNNASGWVDAGVGDVTDAHVYPGPGLPLPDRHRALVLGEFGGLGLPTAGHMWVDQNNWGYRTFTSVPQLDSAYRALLAQLPLMIGDGLSAAVYTQTTDVETESNGLMTYDRAVVKLLPATAAQQLALYGPQPTRRPILMTSRTEGQLWRYTTTSPDSTWMRPEYVDTAWAQGIGGFGAPVPFDYARQPVALHTLWITPDLWLRRTFDMPSTVQGALAWRLYHADDVDVYLNGRLVGHFPGRTSGEVMIPLDSAARAALVSGRNTLAVHAHHISRSPPYLDIGLDEIRPPSHASTP